jgi:type III secretory pathway component EscR
METSKISDMRDLLEAVYVRFLQEISTSHNITNIFQVIQEVVPSQYKEDIINVFLSKFEDLHQVSFYAAAAQEVVPSQYKKEIIDVFLSKCEDLHQVSFYAAAAQLWSISQMNNAVIATLLAKLKEYSEYLPIDKNKGLFDNLENTLDGLLEEKRAEVQNDNSSSFQFLQDRMTDYEKTLDKAKEEKAKLFQHITEKCEAPEPSTENRNTFLLSKIKFSSKLWIKNFLILLENDESGLDSDGYDDSLTLYILTKCKDNNIELSSEEFRTKEDAVKKIKETQHKKEKVIHVSGISNLISITKCNQKILQLNPIFR